MRFGYGMLVSYGFLVVASDYWPGVGCGGAVLGFVMGWSGWVIWVVLIFIVRDPKKKLYGVL